MGLLCLFSGCYQGYVQFVPPEPEIVQTLDLQEFMRNHESPKVVLRVPNPEFIATQAEKNDLLYAAIEKELITAGFQVSDRALFEQILSKSDEKTDYMEMSRRTHTDMILELVKLDSDVSYETNKYYTYEGEQRILPPHLSINASGAKVTFKVILIEENELAGSFTFHYAPCPDGCPMEISPHGVYLKKESSPFQDISYQMVEIDELEEFVKSATRQLIIRLESLKD
ncbi:MAG: hypothetical protein GF421_00810 [Candidatus Aminicenantes bacterium]|nr:hypothetical protein [Candidatus Aminicenantes bacterium]